MLQTLKRLFTREKAVPSPSLPTIEPFAHFPSDAQREVFAQWLANPTTKLALSIVESQIPKPYVMMTGSSEINGQVALVQLAEIRGFQKYRNMLLSLGQATPLARSTEDETYPDQTT